jgi:hypothetical protein
MAENTVISALGDASLHDEGLAPVSATSEDEDPALGSYVASRSSTLNPDRYRRGPTTTNDDKAESVDDSSTDDNVFVDELDESRNDSDSLGSEFQAYARAYRDRMKRRRRGSGSLQRSWCSENRNLVIVGLLQFLAMTSLVLTFVAIEKNTTTPHVTTDPSTPDPASLPVEITYLMPPPDNIDQFCRTDADVGATQTCQEICDQAQCCHISRNMPGSCWNHNLQTCQDYIQACQVVDHRIPTSGDGKKYSRPTIFPNAKDLWDNPDALPPAPDRLSETCTAAFVMASKNPVLAEEASGASLSCHEVCHAASCCWDSSLTEPADRCWTHPNCEGYVEACQVLQKARGEQKLQPLEMNVTDMHPATSHLADSCDPIAITQGIEELLECQEACLPAECCWNKAMLNRCETETTCDGYATACSVLTIPFSRPSEPTTHQLQTMSPPELPERAENTHSTSIATLTHASDSNHSTLPIPELYTLATIRDACWNHDNTVNNRNGQKNVCQQVCQAGSCCFYDGGASGIPTSVCPSYLPANFCDKYKPCDTIFMELTRTWTPTRVREACSDLQDLSDCVTVCAQATCCFTKDPWKACAATHPGVVCSDYHSCEVLYMSEMEEVTYSDNDGLRRHRNLFRRR